jgi:hypothetical protein
VRSDGADRLATDLTQSLVGPFDRWSEEVVSNVGRVVLSTLAGREHEIVWPRVAAAISVFGEKLLEGRGHVHLSHAGIGLRFCDSQWASRKVHVAPAKRQRLADPVAGKRQGCQQRATAGVVVLAPSASSEPAALRRAEVRAGSGELVLDGIDTARRVCVDSVYLGRLRERDGGAAIEHAYAATAYQAQGSTVDRAFVAADPSMDRQELYVASSRSREETWPYATPEIQAQRSEVAPTTPREGLAHIAEAAERDGAQLAAHDEALRSRLSNRSRSPNWSPVTTSCAAQAETTQAPAPSGP